MICNKCGEEILDINKFCTECGNKLKNYESIDFEVEDKKNEAKRFKSKTNGIVNLIFFISTLLFIVGILLFVKLGGYEKDDTNKANVSTNEKSKNDKAQSKVKSKNQTKYLKLSEEEDTEKVKKYYAIMRTIYII